MAYRGCDLGVSRTPLCAGARALLELGLAEASDDVAISRDGSRVDMVGPISWCAERSAAEQSDGVPRFSRWRPFQKFGEEGD